MRLAGHTGALGELSLHHESPPSLILHFIQVYAQNHRPVGLYIVLAAYCYILWIMGSLQTQDKERLKELISLSQLEV